MERANPRCIVVGAGGIAGAWFPPLLEEGVEVAAIVDLNSEAASARAREYGLDCLVTDDLDSALRSTAPDFAVDLTPPEAHADVTVACLHAGAHVIGEKPMAANLDQARRMVGASEQTGRLFMVSQSRRWDRKHDSIRRTLASGAIGKVGTVACDFFLGPHFGGFRDQMESPLILDMAIHHFDLVRFLTGADPEWVFCHEHNPAGSWYRGDAAAVCVFGMSDGSVFSYRGSWCAEGFPTSWNGDWRVVGSRGTLLYASDQEPRVQRVAREDDGFHRPLEEVELVPSSLEKTGMHGALAEMLRFLREGVRPQTECHDNIQSLAMVFAALESSKVDGPVRVRV
ncbi:MAG: Gfo/Idh/MocA family oxidoreductase [Fimbriimonadales bacterium]|nr:Gfo/Idh/MocA family oxidoreductase [Fimbriimonadales bacterium]